MSGGMVALYLLEAVAILLGGLGTPDSMKPLMNRGRLTKENKRKQAMFSKNSKTRTVRDALDVSLKRHKMVLQHLHRIPATIPAYFYARHRLANDIGGVSRSTSEGRCLVKKRNHPYIR